MVERINLDRLREKCPDIAFFEMFDGEAHLGSSDRGTIFVVEKFSERTSDERLIEDIRFVTSEMVSNASYHGNNLNPHKKIRINCGWMGILFYGVVQDEGAGFDINNPHYHAGPPEGGMGIDLSRERVDLLYNIGNTVFFVKKVT